MTSSVDTRTVVSAVKLALMAKQMRARAEAILRAAPIAIVGMGCRVPGGGDTPARLGKGYAPVSMQLGKLPPIVGMAMLGMTPINRLQPNR